MTHRATCVMGMAAAFLAGAFSLFLAFVAVTYLAGS
jgi:hypothetical protein